MLVKKIVVENIFGKKQDLGGKCSAWEDFGMHKFLAETRPGSKVIGLGNLFPLTFFWGGKN